jgi:hypothetical protein
MNAALSTDRRLAVARYTFRSPFTLRLPAAEKPINSGNGRISIFLRGSADIIATFWKSWRCRVRVTTHQKQGDRMLDSSVLAASLSLINKPRGQLSRAFHRGRGTGQDWTMNRGDNCGGKAGNSLRLTMNTMMKIIGAQQERTNVALVLGICCSDT